MKPVYISDLDHTLLRSNASVSDFTRQSWNAKTSTHRLSIATARSFHSASIILDTFHINAPMILLDGALILSPEYEIIDAKFVNEQLANELIDEARHFNGMQPFVIGLKGEGLDEFFDVPKKRNPVQARILQNYPNDERIREHERIYAGKASFKLVYMGTKDQLIALTSHLSTRFGAYFELKLSPENYSGGYFLTILHPLADKADGLRRTSHHLDIDLQHFVVFGDSLNDIGMFKIAGTSVAVANALEETKQHASIVLERSNDEDGVAHYLNASDEQTLHPF